MSIVTVLQSKNNNGYPMSFGEYLKDIVGYSSEIIAKSLSGLPNIVNGPVFINENTRQMFTVLMMGKSWATWGGYGMTIHTHKHFKDALPFLLSTGDLITVPHFSMAKGAGALPYKMSYKNEAGYEIVDVSTTTGLGIQADLLSIGVSYFNKTNITPLTVPYMSPAKLAKLQRAEVSSLYLKTNTATVWRMMATKNPKKSPYFVYPYLTGVHTPYDGALQSDRYLYTPKEMYPLFNHECTAYGLLALHAHTLPPISTSTQSYCDMFV